jgi:hypothetical protein
MKIIHFKTGVEPTPETSCSGSLYQIGYILENGQCPM